MQIIDLNAELKRLLESLQDSKSDNAAMNIISLIREVYELYREQERDSDAEVFNYIKQMGEKEKIERAAPVIKEMIEKEKEIDWAREFEDFMQKKGYWSEFVIEYCDSKFSSLPETSSQYLDEAFESNFILDAFDWGVSRKGGLFWQAVHREWRLRMDKIHSEAQND